MKEFSQEQQEIVLKIIETASKNFCFDIYDNDDMMNEMWIIAHKAFQEYDEEKGEFEHFIRASVKYGTLNFKRDNYKNPRSGSYQEKLNVLKPVDISVIPHYKMKTDNELDRIMSNSETSDLIDARLSSYLRKDYLQIKEGLRPTKNAQDKRANLLKAIRTIIENSEE